MKGFITTLIASTGSTSRSLMLLCKPRPRGKVQGHQLRMLSGGRLFEVLRYRTCTGGVVTCRSNLKDRTTMKLRLKMSTSSPAIAGWYNLRTRTVAKRSEETVLLSNARSLVPPLRAPALAMTA
jgi:hypothetical protein